MFFPPNTKKLLSIIENNLEWNMKDHNDQGMLKSKNSSPKKQKKTKTKKMLSMLNEALN
jgi:hypothetical protein